MKSRSQGQDTPYARMLAEKRVTRGSVRSRLCVARLDQLVPHLKEVASRERSPPLDSSQDRCPIGHRSSFCLDKVCLEEARLGGDYIVMDL